MPYINQDRRYALQPYIDIAHERARPETVGELNYVITQLCRQFLAKSQASYADYNAIVGVLECAKLEFYRRAVSVYEDGKRDTNGEVFT